MARPRRLLAHWLAHSVVALPPTCRAVADRGLVLISPPNGQEHGGQDRVFQF
jgi:hypothetical protein